MNKSLLAIGALVVFASSAQLCAAERVKLPTLEQIESRRQSLNTVREKIARNDQALTEMRVMLRELRQAVEMLPQNRGVKPPQALLDRFKNLLQKEADLDAERREALQSL